MTEGRQKETAPEVNTNLKDLPIFITGITLHLQFSEFQDNPIDINGEMWHIDGWIESDGSKTMLISNKEKRSNYEINIEEHEEIESRSIFEIVISEGTRRPIRELIAESIPIRKDDFQDLNTILSSDQTPNDLQP